MGEFPKTPGSAKKKMFELSPRRIANPQAQIARGGQQSGRLVLALALLLAALAGILIKDRQFWFGSEQATIDSDAPETTASQPVAKPATRTAAVVRAHSVTRQGPATGTTAAPDADAPAVTLNRTVLPPLDIEVIAGTTHRKLHPGSNLTKLEITNPAMAQSAPPATNASEREPIADAQPAYPLLAQHMNVQGAVILQALIGADGVVENLRVLSGPAILASAAQQAVREWRFKPIVQNGQAVESKATITVNFTIKVADNSAKTTIAESRAAESLIITR
jgi:TonB family protein